VVSVNDDLLAIPVLLTAVLTAALAAFLLARRRAGGSGLVPVARDQVLEQLGDPVLVIDERGQLVDLNPAAQRLLGVGGVGAVGRDAPLALAGWPALAASVAEGGRPVHLAGAAGPATYDVRVAPLSGRGGQVVVLRDVTDRQRAEEALRQAQGELEQRVRSRTAMLERAVASLQESERRFRGVFDGAFQLVGLLDPAGRLLAANRTALEFAGVAEAEVVGRPFWETPWWSRSPEERAALRDAVGDAARGRVVRFPATHADREGRLHRVDFSLKAVLDEQGHPALLVAEGRDVTELHEMQEARGQLQAQLLQAQKLESIGRLAGGVAHDFNNLLTSILGNAGMAQEELPPGSPLHQPLEEILHAGQSAAALTRQLLAFSRKQVVEPKVVDLNLSLERVRGVLARTLGAEVRLQTALAPGLWPIFIDPGQVEQVVMNLAVNARDAMPNGGDLTLETGNVTWDAAAARRRGEGAAPGDWVRLVVTDSGVGMTPEVLTHAFEPFFTTKPEGQGTGLGLATVYGVVRQHGGVLGVSSRPGQGTTFEIFLPRADAVEGVGGADGAAAKPQGRERIMVVEDQEQVRNLVALVLGRLGYRVEAHGDPLQAQRALEAGAAPDLLVTDVSMPGLSGGALVQLARRRHPGLRVLFMSGYLDDAVARLGVATGEVQLLHKPFTPEQLAGAVRRELDASPGATPQGSTGAP
jgi:PAS domain S-box-containing protein